MNRAGPGGGAGYAGGAAVSAPLEEIERGLATAIGQGEELAGYLERGQAVMPLAEEFHRLEPEERQAPLSLLLLGLTAEVRTLALGWLIGPEHRHISVRIPDALGWVEVRVQERGYSLETATSGRQEFDSLEGFLAAVQDTGLTGADAEGGVWVEPVRLGLAGPPPLRSLRILMPRDPGVVEEHPAAAARLTAEAPLLCLAAESHHPWSKTDRAALQSLRQGAAALWCLVVGRGQAPVFGWWEDVGGGLPALPLTWFEPAAPPALPGFLIAGPRDPLRRALRAARLGRRLAVLGKMTRERLDTEMRQLEARRKREARIERTIGGGDEDLRARFDALRAAFLEAVGQLQLGIKEANRVALLKSGKLAGHMEQLVDSLGPEDLERELTHKTLRLSLKPALLAELRRRIAKSLRVQLDEDCILLRDGLASAREALEAGLGQMGAQVRSIAYAVPDNQELWEPLSQMLEMEIRYRGELPRRTFIHRLGEGRRLVFLVLMTLSLVGSFVGLNTRKAAYLGVALLFLFVGAVIYTYFSWRKEEQANLAEEIQKAKEALKNELLRVVGEIQREKLVRLGAAVDAIRRDVQLKLDGLLRDSLATRARTAESERREAQGRLRLIDQRLREMNGVEQRLRAFQQQAQRLEEGGGTAVRETIHALAGGKP